MPIPRFSRYANFGFRCVKHPSKEPLSSVLAAQLTNASRNYGEEQPVSSRRFRAYRTLFSYDKTALSPAIEPIDGSNADWKKERITFDAAYGNERVIASLFLPKKFAPPYQTIIWFPYGDAIHLSSSNGLTIGRIDFVLKSGRAVLYPVFKGTLKEEMDGNRDWPDATSFYRDHVIYWVKDLSR